MNYKQALAKNYTGFQNFLLEIQSNFKTNSESIHKARNELKILHHEGKNLVIKSFKIPHLINRIIYSYFKDSKAKKSYEHSLKINTYTPEPVGYIEFYSFGLIRESYFISLEFKYDFTIREPLLDTNFAEKEEIFRAFARFTLKLHNDNIFHEDYSPGNILIKKQGTSYKFKIVDINRMHFHLLDEDERARAFAKLWASDEILKLIADEYKKYYRCSDEFTRKVLYFSNKNKKIKNFKKRLKGKPVND